MIPPKKETTGMLLNLTQRCQDAKVLFYGALTKSFIIIIITFVYCPGLSDCKLVLGLYKKKT